MISGNLPPDNNVILEPYIQSIQEFLEKLGSYGVGLFGNVDQIQWRFSCSGRKTW